MPTHVVQAGRWATRIRDDSARRLPFGLYRTIAIPLTRESFTSASLLVLLTQKQFNGSTIGLKRHLS
jgi:hypothetical protein